MSRLDELPPDQRAALSLLVGRGKSYADVGRMLRIEDRAVHDRAHAALAVLAPAEARALSAEERADIGDYLLGQQASPAERLRTRAQLETSPSARAWAHALAGELRPLASDGFPEIPSPPPEPPAVPEPPAAREPAAHAGSPPPAAAAASPPRSSSPPASRVGGALLLAAMLAGIVVAVVFLTKGGSGGHANRPTARLSTSGPRVAAKLTLRPATPGSSALGLVDVLTEGSKRAFYIVAEKLPETRGFFYALWLYNSPTSAEPLSRAPSVGSSHHLEGGSLLPANAGSYRELLLTRETKSKPSHPGPVVLHGPFTLG